MSAQPIFPTNMSVADLARVIGTPSAPAIIDVRDEDDFAADPRLVPAAMRQDYRKIAEWAPLVAPLPTLVVCQKGQKLSEGAAAWLRQSGIPAASLAGGVLAWREAGQPMVPVAKMPKPGADGRTVWVTRTRPKIDRIACPWLIRRFVDRAARFLFVPPSEVQSVAERFGATAFDIEGVFWSHRGERCSFDTMVEELGLATPALTKLADIVRGADTARLDLVPEAAGFLAVSLGLSRLIGDDLAQLDAGMLVYDAMFAWCREAQGETHNWPAARAA